MNPERKQLMLKIYFLVGAVAGLIGTLIGYGGMLNQLFQKALITDEEYIANSMYYEIQQCEQPVYDNTVAAVDGKTAAPKAKTPEEITKCKNDATLRITNQRSYQIKSSLIDGGVRGTLFFLLFITHLPRLRRAYKEEENA